MKLLKVRIGDAFNAGSAYTLLKRIGVKGTMTLVAVQDKMLDYVFDGRKYSNERAERLQEVFGRFGLIYRNGIYMGLDKEDLKKLFFGAQFYYA